MKRFHYALLLLFCSAIWLGCQKELSQPGIDNPPVITSTAPITATLQGVVVDENGAGASGVTIKVGNKTITTNNNGFFRILNAALDKNAALVTAEKAGYFKALRSFQATAGANHVSIKLIKKEMVGTISSGSGGNVTLSNGSKISLPADGVVKAAGGAYNGTINVYAAYIDPTAADIAQTIPGSFMANDKDGRRVTLASYGMLAVELESASGEKLQIASGKKATLTAPIPASIQSSAPANIAMWYVDEQTGLWKEEGSAVKSGNNYTGDVSHFSFWNYDISGSAVNMTLTLHNAEGSPLVHALVRATVLGGGWNGGWGMAYGYTDSLGKVSGLVPANQPLKIEVLDNCSNVIYTQNVGPFTQNTNLGTIVITNPGSAMVTIKGKLLNCTGNPVINGYAIVDINFPRYVSTNSTGDFSVTVLWCGTPSTFNIVGVDNATQQQATVSGIPVVTPIINTGNITACGTSAVQFINYTFNSNNYSLSSTNAADSIAGYTTGQGTNYNTTITGYNFPSSYAINLSISGPQTPGTYPLVYIAVQDKWSAQIITPSNLTLTNYPSAAGGFYEGNFSGSFKDSSNMSITHTVSGNFRVRRN